MSLNFSRFSMNGCLQAPCLIDIVAIWSTDRRAEYQILRLSFCCQDNSFQQGASTILVTSESVALHRSNQYEETELMGLNLGRYRARVIARGKFNCKAAGMLASCGAPKILQGNRPNSRNFQAGSRSTPGERPTGARCGNPG